MQIYILLIIGRFIFVGGNGQSKYHSYRSGSQWFLCYLVLYINKCDNFLMRITRIEVDIFLDFAKGTEFFKTVKRHKR